MSKDTHNRRFSRMYETIQIAAFDLDGTLTKTNSSFAFCRYLQEKGFLSKTDLFFCFYFYICHLYCGLSLWDLHTKIFERSFQGKSLSQIAPLIDSFLKEKLDNLWYLPALIRLEKLKQKGVRCLILSNSPYFLVQCIGKKLGVEEVYATEYTSEAGRLKSLSLCLDGVKKKEILDRFSGKKMAFSDSVHDLPFLEAADFPVAVNPTGELKRIAKRKHWEIL